MLLFALDRSRAQFAWKCGGLDAAGLQQGPPAVGDDPGRPAQAPGPRRGRATGRRVPDRELVRPPWTPADFDADPDWEWHSAADDSPEELYALWQGAVERSRAAWRAAARRRRARPAVDVHHRRPASRPTSGGCWSTCTTSTPATSATRTSSARPSTAWWERTRRSHDDGHGGADPRRAADHRPGQRGVVGRPRRDLRHHRLPGPVPVPEVQGRRLDLARLHAGGADRDAPGADRLRRPERRGHQRAGGLRRRRAGGLGRGRAADGVPQAAHLSRPVDAVGTRTRTTTTSGR